MNSETDEYTVRRILAGNTQLYSIIVKRYERPIYNLMYRYSRREQEAADLTQDVFLKAFNKLSTFDCKRRFFSWIYSLAVNRARDWQRNNVVKLRALNELQWEKPTIENGSQQEKNLLAGEEINNLYAALEKLPEITREIILLRYKEELPIAELARIFQLSESAVKMRISRGLGKMKQVLGGERYGSNKFNDTYQEKCFEDRENQTYSLEET